jgi:hypothetical protein
MSNNLDKTKHEQQNWPHHSDCELVSLNKDGIKAQPFRHDIHIYGSSAQDAAGGDVVLVECGPT